LIALLKDLMPLKYQLWLKEDVTKENATCLTWAAGTQKKEMVLSLKTNLSNYIPMLPMDNQTMDSTLAWQLCMDADNRK
jgi:hypothetical protein